MSSLIRFGRTSQAGSSLLIVLVLLTVMLLGALTMARFTESSTLISGNVAFKDAAMQASEVGVSDAVAALQSLTSEESNQGGWYFASKLIDGPDGLPTTVAWGNAMHSTVGLFDVAYILERLCEEPLPVTDLNQQCVLKILPASDSNKAGADQLEPPVAKQYRVTVSVTGPKMTQTFVQVMALR